MSTNRLILEKSPYLLQHAHNPVDWFAWGEEAFARARADDRPIFLSIGYATCHWCHVMERESFENEQTAHLMNEHFIAIKVDREELPEVDALYMAALQATGQTGGWPLNMFLAPDLQPLFGGTYFPPEPRWGRPSFDQVLTAIADLWQNNRSRLTESGRSLKEFLAEQEGMSGAQHMPSRDLVSSVPGILSKFFDEEWGGFVTSGTNKFPPCLSMMLLIRLFRRSRDPQLLRMVEKTLEGMRRGGIYDQIGGGIARYSTDPEWLVPHFEKMLYDNALLAQTLVEAFRVTQNPRYREWAEDIFAYIARDMTSPEGAFYSAEDADSEGEEGRFYVWSRAELSEELLQNGLSPASIELLCSFWGITEKGNFEGRNILHETSDRSEYARSHGIPEEDFTALIGRAREILLADRSRRVRPLRDDKILLAWNALMISALARGSLAFARPDLAERATRAADFLEQSLRVDGRWLRRFRDGEARFPATLSDHALMGLAYLDLFRVTGNPRYYAKACELADLILALFFENNRIYETEPNPHLIARITDCYDGVHPSGPSAALQLLVSLARYGSTPGKYEDGAVCILRQFAERMAETPHGCTAMLSGVLSFLSPRLEIVVTGFGSGPAAEAVNWIGGHLEAETILAGKHHNALAEPAEEAPIPLLDGKSGSEFAIYICENLACRTPLKSIEALEQALSA